MLYSYINILTCIQVLNYIWKETEETYTLEKKWPNAMHFGKDKATLVKKKYTLAYLIIWRLL